MTRQVRITEPLGARAAALPLDLGGAGTALAVPGIEGIAVTITDRGGQWLAEPAPGTTVLLNGLALRAAQPLAAGDVLGIGAAQVTVHPDQARVEVVHLAGNATVAPLRPSLLPGDEIQAGVQEIFAARAADQAAAARGGSRTARWIGAGVVAAVLLAGAALLFSLVAVPLQLSPEGASVQSPGLIDWHSGDRVFLLPGRRELTVSHPGYRSQALTLDVSRGLADAAPLPVQLEYLPGILEIDTGGIEAEVLVDGSAGGKAPGELSVEAGTRDVIVRAPRYIDHVARIDVKGGGERQPLQVSLRSAIGQLVLDTEPAGAIIRVDDQELGRAPQRLELDAGLHRLVLSAPGRRAWSSEVAIIAGQTLDLGRIDLALPPPAVARATTGVPESISAGSAPAGEVVATPPPPRPPPPARAQSELLGTLVLLPAGEYRQGSERREQGRRSNEVQRTVRLTRAFYMSATEVSNAQFRAFKPTHVSGLAMEKSLDLDPQAVTNVSWNDAVEFCNWLSLREGLPAAYERRSGRWQLVQPVNHGYRLPTEAEWEYASRYVDGQRWQRHAWGDVLPPPAGTTNVAGAEALPQKAGSGVPAISTLPQYRDEHAVVAPVDSYARSAMGLYGLGGNVSEWTHDVYLSLPDSATATDPMGPEADGPHAIRGANWRSAAIAELRAAWRDRASGASNTIGFRVVRFAEELQ